MTISTKRTLCIAGIVVGGLLTLGPTIGLLGTVIGMMRAFATLGDSGVADPEGLSSAIGSVLLSTFLGLLVLLPGIALLVASIIIFNKTPRPAPANS